VNNARPLRVIQVFSRYLQPGGEEKSVARMAEDLEGAGHLVRRFWRASAEWQGLGAPPRWRQALLLRQNSTVLAALRALHAETRPDLWLVHNVLPVVSLGVYRLACQLDVPILQWLHNYRPISPSGTLFAGARKIDPNDPHVAWKEIRAGTWHGPLLTAWLAWNYERVRRRGDFEAVRAWVAISEQMNAVFQRAGWFPDRLRTLRHAWHIQGPVPAGRDEGYFLFLGRLTEAKGVRFLVNLWREPALREVPLVIAGQGDSEARLRGQAPAHVRWVGHVEGEAKCNLLAGCRAVLFPCLWDEPLGLVGYEAFEMAKPLLASRAGGIQEIVQDGRTGRLLAPGDKDAWHDAILRLDAPTARQLGLAGRIWLEKNTSSAEWARRFEALAREVIPGL
jgi:glycosyltransferase involved in cell wall biosynthesis